MTQDVVNAPSGIGYPVWRRGKGPPLLLLHGFTGSHETWHYVVNQLQASHSIVTLDLPGHGQSELPVEQCWTFPAVVDDLAWIIGLLLAGNADVLGYSMGGRLALALAASHPARVHSLTLESASPGIANEHERGVRQQADEHLAACIQREGLEAFVAHWERLPMWSSQAVLPESELERQRRTRLGHTSTGLASNLLRTGTGAQPSYWERLADLKTPTMLIAGELDHKFAQIAARMHEVITNSRLEIVSSAGHAVHLEQPARYVQLVSQFLEQPVLNSRATKESARD